MEQKLFCLQLKKGNYIEIKDDNMTVKVGHRTITDKIENFVLSNFKIYMGCDICFFLQNFENELRWEYEGFANKETQEKAKEFVEIMDKYGVFENRSRVDVLYNLNEKEKALTHKPIQIEKQKCPRCGGENYHAFVEEKIIREGKTKTTVSLNLNPLKPFTVLNQKEKVVRQPVTTHISKFVCDDCGKIFNKNAKAPI